METIRIRRGLIFANILVLFSGCALPSNPAEEETSKNTIPFKSLPKFKFNIPEQTRKYSLTSEISQPFKCAPPRKSDWITHKTNLFNIDSSNTGILTQITNLSYKLSVDGYNVDISIYEANEKEFSNFSNMIYIMAGSTIETFKFSQCHEGIKYRNVIGACETESVSYYLYVSGTLFSLFVTKNDDSWIDLMFVDELVRSFEIK